LLFGLVIIVLAWWLPQARRAALYALLALAGLGVPLLLADPLMVACGLVVAAAALAPVLAQGDDDGGAALFIGLAALGAACLVIGLAAARLPSTPEVVSRVPLARAAVMTGFGLLLGCIPPLFWLPGVSRWGHPVGAALAAGLFPAMTLVVIFDVLNGPGLGWLVSGLEGQTIVPAGVLTLLVAGLLAIVQSDVRRLVGCLLVADLGCMIVTLGAGLQDGGVPPAAAILSQVLGRGLAVLVVFPCLSLLTGGCTRALRPAVILLLVCGAWMALGGPLTAAFAARWAALQPLLAGDQLWARLLMAGIVANCLACAVLLARAIRSPLVEADRPALWLALLILTAIVALSLLLWRNPAWLDAQITGVVAWLVGS
jgi:formate hydrogenlyase subunit 3/multisubunit Na+/H+ antiporter MnhD subunit